MRRTGKMRRKKQKKIIIISALSLLLMITVGYAAFQTNLSITAKGNVKEKSRIIQAWDANSQTDFHSDYYKQLKLYIVNDIYENMRILPGNYKELAFDVTSNKALFNVNDSSEEEEYTGNVFDLIYQFGNISLDNSNNTQIVNIILQINNLLEKEKDYTPKERQYILLNNRKIKRDDN